MPEVIKQIKERRKVEFEENNIKYQLWRLDDFEYRKLRQSSLPIKEDYDFYWNIHYSERDRDKTAIQSLESEGVSELKKIMI